MSKTKVKLEALKVKSFVTLSEENVKEVKAGGPMTRTRACPITDSYHYKSCGPECSHVLTFFCDTSFGC